MSHASTQLHMLVAERLQLTDLTDEAQHALADRAIDVLSKRVFLDVLPQLSDDDRTRLQTLLADGSLSEDEIDTFVREVMDRYPDVVRRSVDAFFAAMDAVLSPEGSTLPE